MSLSLDGFIEDPTVTSIGRFPTRSCTAWELVETRTFSLRVVYLRYERA